MGSIASRAAGTMSAALVDVVDVGSFVGVSQVFYLFCELLFFGE